MTCYDVIKVVPHWPCLLYWMQSCQISVRQYNVIHKCTYRTTKGGQVMKVMTQNVRSFIKTLLHATNTREYTLICTKKRSVLRYLTYKLIKLTWWAWWRLKSPVTPLFFNRLFRRTSKKTSKLRVTGLCEGNPPVTGGFPSQKARDVEMFPFHDVIMILLMEVTGRHDTTVDYTQVAGILQTDVLCHVFGQERTILDLFYIYLHGCYTHPTHGCK